MLMGHCLHFPSVASILSEQRERADLGAELDEVSLLRGQVAAERNTHANTRRGFQVNKSVRLLLDLAQTTDHILLYRHGNMQKPTEVWGAAPVCQTGRGRERRGASAPF